MAAGATKGKESGRLHKSPSKAARKQAAALRRDMEHYGIRGSVLERGGQEHDSAESEDDIDSSEEDEMEEDSDEENDNNFREELRGLPRSGKENMKYSSSGGISMQDLRRKDNHSDRKNAIVASTALHSRSSPSSALNAPQWAGGPNLNEMQQPTQFNPNQVSSMGQGEVMFSGIFESRVKSYIQELFEKYARLDHQVDAKGVQSMCCNHGTYMPIEQF